MFSVALCAAVGQAVADLLEPWPLKIVIDTVLRSRPGKGWLTELISSRLGDHSWVVLRISALAVLVIAAAGSICSYSEKYLTTHIGQWVTHELRQTLYAHIQRLSLDCHNRQRVGDLLSRVTSDIDAVQSFIASGLLEGVINSLTLTGMVAVLLYVDWRFSMIALSVTPLLFVVIYRHTRGIKEASREVRKKESELVSFMQEVFSSISVVKAFSREELEQRRLEKESLQSIKIAQQARKLKVRLSPLVDMIVALGTCFVLWFGGGLALRGELSAGSLVLFIWYLGRVYKPMRELSKMTDAYSKAAVGYERVREVLETDHVVTDAPGAYQAPKLRGEIELANVSFSYEPNCPILRDVSLVVKPGHLAALVGPTGAGKTTITNLIARFYDPATGTVKIDGIDVKCYQQKSVRQQISFVLQDTQLFYGPVWYNIAYGKSGATRAEVVGAAKLANADEFIEQLPDQYNTVIGERGMTLSGGQRQRIAIARALIRNTPILILDEVTTGLDSVSEKLVFEALDRLMRNRTSIVITHRLSTICAADVIFVVQGGRIVERGSHLELLGNDGPYAKLFSLHFQPIGFHTTTRQSALL
jgi:subfamily B ATP-binding cassette protein MsbA